MMNENGNRFSRQALIFVMILEVAACKVDNNSLQLYTFYMITDAMSTGRFDSLTLFMRSWQEGRERGGEIDCAVNEWLRRIE
jgi:hypothetical protein